MPEHHRCAQDHGRGICAIRAHDIAGDMTATGFKQSIFLGVYE